MPPIDDEKFLAIVDRMLTEGGEWKVAMSKAGTFMTYKGQTNEISGKQADVMFRFIPRKCSTPSPIDSSAWTGR